MYRLGEPVLLCLFVEPVCGFCFGPFAFLACCSLSQFCLFVELVCGFCFGPLGFLACCSFWQLCLFVELVCGFCFGPLAFQAGAPHGGPLPVLSFLLQANAFPLLLLPGTFLFCPFPFLAGAFLGGAFLGRPFPFLAGAFPGGSLAFFPGGAFLLGGLLTRLLNGLLLPLP